MTQSTFHRFAADSTNGHPERHRPLFRRVMSRVAPMPPLPELEPLVDAVPDEPVVASTASTHVMDLWEAFSAYASAQFSDDRRDGTLDRARVGQQRLLELNGITSAAAKSLSLGLYTTPDDVRVYLRSVGFSEEAIEDSGLVTDADGRLRHDWSGRIVGPIRDRFGRVVDLFSMESGGAWHPTKYRFLHGFSETFAVGYGADQAFGSTSLPTKVILVDDLLDAAALHEAGLLNVLAIGGSGEDFTSDRWEQLTDLGVQEVELVFRQSALREASIRGALEQALKARRAPQVWVFDSSRLGDSTSAGEYVRRHGAAPFRSIIATPALAFYGKEFGGERRYDTTSSASARFAVMPVEMVERVSRVVPVAPVVATPVAPQKPVPLLRPFDREAFLTSLRPCIDHYSANSQVRTNLWRQVHAMSDALGANNFALAREIAASLPLFQHTPYPQVLLNDLPLGYRTPWGETIAPLTTTPQGRFAPAQAVVSTSTPQRSDDWRADTAIDRLCHGTSSRIGAVPQEVPTDVDPQQLTLLTITSRTGRLHQAASTLLDELELADSGAWLVASEFHPDELMLYLITEQANRLASGPGHSPADVQCRMRGVEPAKGFQDKPWLIDEAVDRLRLMQDRFAFVPAESLFPHVKAEPITMPETTQRPAGVIYVAESVLRRVPTSGTPYAHWEGRFDTTTWATDFAAALSKRLPADCQKVAIVPPTEARVSTPAPQYIPVAFAPVGWFPHYADGTAATPLPVREWTPQMATPVETPTVGIPVARAKKASPVLEAAWPGEPTAAYWHAPYDSSLYRERSELRSVAEQWIRQTEQQT
ncbi:MAG: hypothetical protein R3C01_16920 [Planctomycetaceae bacterium]